MTTKGDDMLEGHNTKGVQAYRWIVLGAMAAAAFFLARTADKLDKTYEAVGTIQQSVTALNGRLDAQAERLADHDRRIGRLESPYFGFTPQQAQPHKGEP